MKTREELAEFKKALYWSSITGRCAREWRSDYSEHAAEIDHFETWLWRNKSTLDYDCGRIHNLAFETNLLDNMKLAERLYRIEQDIETIKFPETD
jgi:hypothetical protein